MKLWNRNSSFNYFRTVRKNEFVHSFFGRSYGSTILFRDLLTFSSHAFSIYFTSVSSTKGPCLILIRLLVLGKNQRHINFGDIFSTYVFMSSMYFRPIKMHNLTFLHFDWRAGDLETWVSPGLFNSSHCNQMFFSFHFSCFVLVHVVTKIQK